MENPLFAPELHTLAQDFLWNADHTLADSSPFYEKLARCVAADGEMLAIAAHAQKHQPAMNLFFSAVHFLLLRGVDDPLRAFYADLTPVPNVAGDPYPLFRAFVLNHAGDVIELVSTHRVQTNEIARCALFLPAFGLVGQRVKGKRCQLIEVGSSAGLNLNWDRYAFDYGTGKVYGDAASPILLRCELRGGLLPLQDRMPEVEKQVGIDLHPNDVFDEDAMLWLRALVWPEQQERAERLKQAIVLARRFPPTILQGDALELVPQLIAGTPRETPTILFHSFVLNQMPKELRARYYELLAEQSRGRLLFDVAIEPSAFPSPMVLTTFEGGERRQEALARCDHHGRWLEWIADDAAI